MIYNLEGRRGGGGGGGGDYPMIEATKPNGAKTTA